MGHGQDYVTHFKFLDRQWYLATSDVSGMAKARVIKILYTDYIIFQL